MYYFYYTVNELKGKGVEELCNNLQLIPLLESIDLSRIYCHLMVID